ncbi:beta-N-acetylhexosaminidase [Stygiobacter electus]|uniref:beta-N-acetylhexosaminidase n=1 Tax=Stygiobacter electus TaxID=3032292 RepID=A0AAE3P3E3_9BACT|nr:beta-N-acetylhexosaminidase [Stygiobacter electus]MDF1613057.1 beta-N-acetylhexosaminidase [Stygiobacter electus]
MRNGLTMYYRYKKIRLYIFSLLIVLQFISCRTTAPIGDNTQYQDLSNKLGNVIPKPVTLNPTTGTFTINESSKIYIEPNNSETAFIGQYLADKIKSSTNYDLVVLASSGIPPKGNIYLTTIGGDPSLGDEGYELNITENILTLFAFKPEGLFRGVQTLRQILFSSIEPFTHYKEINIGTGIIRDYPRFQWRGVMLDVARHFFSVGDVKKLIDLISYYKINRFHLHLTDDQGWRIQIDSYPKLTLYGGSTQVKGGPAGYYTKSEYLEIIKYAKERYITVIPEIDMPGHTNAALASYPFLNCNGVSPSLYTGTEVGFSSLCTKKDSTYIFINDVIKEIAQLSPGPYIHIGGDEAKATNSADYINFIEKVQSIIYSNGKKMIGWDELGQCKLQPETIVQHWANDSLALEAVKKGVKLIMSPASKTYMDMKYNSTTLLGQNWAGYIEVSDSYNWNPLTQIKGLTMNDILGVEAPLWTETISNLDDIEFMFFPRLPGIAEIGWSPITVRNWEEYKKRLSVHGRYWKKIGLNFYHSPEINWK